MTNTKILLVEDNFVTSDEIRDRLVQLGFPAIAAAYSGAEAVTLAEDFQPDLILMDIHLGAGIDGIEAAKRIQARRSAPVIYLTAYDNDATLARARITDPSAYLLKPVRERELHVAIEIALYKHQAEAALQASEERLRLILDNTQDIIFMQDVQGKYLYYNGPSVYGLSSEDVIGKTPYDFHDEETAAAMMANLRHVIASGERLEREMSVVWQGETLWFLDEITPVRNTDDQVVAVSQLSRNITERKRAEEELRRSEQRFRAVFEQAAAGIAIALPDEKIIDVNQKLCDMLGHTKKELLQQTVPELTPPEDRERELRQVQGILAGNQNS